MDPLSLGYERSRKSAALGGNESVLGIVSRRNRGNRYRKPWPCGMFSRAHWHIKGGPKERRDPDRVRLQAVIGLLENNEGIVR